MKMKRGYCVTSDDLPGFITEGETFIECFEMMKDCLACYIEPWWTIEEKIKNSPELPTKQKTLEHLRQSTSDLNRMLIATDDMAKHIHNKDIPQDALDTQDFKDELHLLQVKLLERWNKQKEQYLKLLFEGDCDDMTIKEVMDARTSSNTESNNGALVDKTVIKVVKNDMQKTVVVSKFEGEDKYMMEASEWKRVSAP